MEEDAFLCIGTAFLDPRFSGSRARMRRRRRRRRRMRRRENRVYAAPGATSIDEMQSTSRIRMLKGRPWVLKSSHMASFVEEDDGHGVRGIIDIFGGNNQSRSILLLRSRLPLPILNTLLLLRCHAPSPSLFTSLLAPISILFAARGGSFSGKFYIGMLYWYQ